MTFIEKDKVTKDYLAKCFNEVGIECAIVGERLKLASAPDLLDIDVDVRVFEQQNFIRISTYMNFKEGVTREEAVGFLDRVGAYILVNFRVPALEDGQVVLDGRYDCLYSHGLSISNFIETVQAFATSFISAIGDEDEDDEFFDRW